MCSSFIGSRSGTAVKIALTRLCDCFSAIWTGGFVLLEPPLNAGYSKNMATEELNSHYIVFSRMYSIFLEAN
jgi:hypothetical protein